MKHRNFLPVALLLALTSLLWQSCARVYTSPGFERKTRTHETVAILPFQVDIVPRKLPKDVTEASIREQEVKTGLGLQRDAYAWFLRRSDRKQYTVTFQDVDKTNSILAKEGITAENIRTHSKDELARLLGVDAVISGDTRMTKPMSEGAALAVGVIFGVWGATNEVTINLTIHDKKEGELLWKYDYVASGSVGNSTAQLTNNLLRNASRKFPYQKK